MHGCNAGAVHGGELPHGLDRDHSSLDQLAPTVDTSTLDRGDPPFEAGRAVDHGGLQVPNSQRDGGPGRSGYHVGRGQDEVECTRQHRTVDTSGHATFTSPYEGAPGCVHGAVLAGAFDL